MPAIQSPDPRRRTPSNWEWSDCVWVASVAILTALSFALVPQFFVLALAGVAIYFAVITKRTWLRTLICCLLFPGVLLLLLPSMGAVYYLETLVGLLAGWWHFLVRTLPDVTVSPADIATFAIAIVLLTAGVHFVAGRIMERRRDESAQRNWSIAQSMRIVCLFTLTFVASLAFVGAVHQTDWLVNSPTPALDYQGGGMFSRHKLHDMGSALFDASDEQGRFPFGIMSQDSQALHGWQTMLLPHLDKGGLYNQINLQQSWRAPSNREVFEQTVDAFQSRKFLAHETTAEGYAMSHFAANMHIIKPGAGLAADEITDGAAHTILAGEVASRFRAWGDPFNLRDSALGLNHPEGFATPWDYSSSRGGVFLFVDGHVQTINDNIDPAIFEALGTPNAGDDEEF